MLNTKITPETVKENIKRKSVKDIFTLQTASFINRAINIASSIVFARILGPDNYGLYALIFVFTGLLGLTDIGYTRAAVVLLPEAYIKRDKKAIKNILTSLLKINLVFYLPLYLLIIIFAPYLTNQLYHNPEIGSLARLVIFAMILFSFSSILNLNLEARRKMKHLAIIENASIFLKGLLAVIFVIAGLGLFGIVLGHAIGMVVITLSSFIIYLYWSRKDEYIPSLLSLLKNLKQISIKYNLKFSLTISADSHLGKFLFDSLPILILSLIATPAVVGFYKIALSYVSLPTMLISPISRLLNVKFPQDKTIDIKLLKKNFYRSAFLIGAIFIFILAPFVLLSPYIIPLFYGAEFIPAVKISYALAGFIVFAGLGIGFGPIYRATKKVHLGILFNIFRTIFGAIMFIIMYYAFNFTPLTSVLSFKLLIGLSAPIHLLYIKKFILDKLNNFSN